MWFGRRPPKRNSEIVRIVKSVLMAQLTTRVESNYGLVWWAENISFGLARFGSTKKSLVLVDIPLSVTPAILTTNRRQVKEYETTGENGKYHELIQGALKS